MLTNYFWGNWNGDDHAGNKTNLGALIRDEEEKDLEDTVQDLDELADRLLTQFPAYGTATNHAVQDQAWLQSNNEEEEDPNGYPSFNNNAGPMIPASVTDTRLNKAFPGMLAVGTLPDSQQLAKTANFLHLSSVSDWDFDEQCLWKAVGGEEEKSSEPRKGYANASSRNNNNDGRPYVSVQDVKQQPPPKQQQQWMYGRNNNYHQPDHMDTISKNQASLNANSALDRSNRHHSSATANDTTSSSGTHNAIQDFADSRQHWMPDQLCKHCYACDTPFTVFRRRHHCRLCGQVFCSACSAYFVPSQKKGSSTLRTCQMCYDQVAQRGGLLMASKEDSDQAERTDGSSIADDAKKIADDTTSSRREEDGRPVIADTKTLTIQTSPSALRSPKDRDANKKLSSNSNPKGEPQATQQQDSELASETHWRAASEIPSAQKDAAAQEAKRHLGLTAANHLEKMGEALLQKDAPLLWQEITKANRHGAPQIKKQWLDKLMTLATRCCATVEPDVKAQDLLDIRPYCKIKVIPGGTFQDCAYLSGIIFRKTVSHKRMAKEVVNPKIMLLSGGIEFTRTENRFASLHTLLEQEGKYMEILVGRILKLKPDVVCVGRSVSRRALELFLKANIVLIQHVKPTLMRRISRQTGASIISSTEHIMNQFGANPLGKCSRFRLVTFRDNEIWVDPLDTDADIYDYTSSATENQRSIRKLLKTPDLANHERQAALAANVLGDGVVDGAEAVKSGLAKRGVAQTFVMLER